MGQESSVMRIVIDQIPRLQGAAGQYPVCDKGEEVRILSMPERRGIYGKGFPGKDLQPPARESFSDD